MSILTNKELSTETLVGMVERNLHRRFGLDTHFEFHSETRQEGWDDSGAVEYFHARWHDERLLRGDLFVGNKRVGKVEAVLNMLDVNPPLFVEVFVYKRRFLRRRLVEVYTQEKLRELVGH